jgi:hypothetical protein
MPGRWMNRYPVAHQPTAPGRRYLPDLSPSFPPELATRATALVPGATLPPRATGTPAQTPPQPPHPLVKATAASLFGRLLRQVQPWLLGQWRHQPRTPRRRARATPLRSRPMQRRRSSVRKNEELFLAYARAASPLIHSRAATMMLAGRWRCCQRTVMPRRCYHC